MTKGQSSSVVGDSKMTPLRAKGVNLKNAAELPNIPANSAHPSPSSDTSANIRAALIGDGVAAKGRLTCKQRIWLSFFFDGTGNNLDADLDLLKHSNVARLFRVHRPTEPASGIFRFYIPGIGTYFKEVGDNGGSAAGNAFGSMGQARLNFALRQFDETLARPISLTNSALSRIEEINIAVFGFSRGAALARAFVSILMETRCIQLEGRWKLRNVDAPVKFRFMGLFDTVASVGQPMSRNNTDYVNPALGDVAGMIEERLEDYPDTAPQALAFGISGAAGADPAPGDYAGHDAWGARMAIHESVMEVRHFVAAHEVRNSFPVDSISIMDNTRVRKPPHFYETVYPGSHSDVGGGYAPGEGAKAILPSDNFCLIPLRHMYDYALRQNVPLLPITSQRNIQDFEVSDGLRNAYDHYIKLIGTGSGVGELLNKHREVYFAWRFSSIRKKKSGTHSDIALIREYKEKYRAQEEVLAGEVARLAKVEKAARLKFDLLARAQQISVNPMAGVSQKEKGAAPEVSAFKSAQQQYLRARDDRLKAEAKRNAVPNMENFEATLSLYDRQLMADVKSVLSALSRPDDYFRSVAHRENLRPHYKALIKAYEDEFQNNSGLKDMNVSAFFDLYVHDSLAGFARDATLPSDPRVVYVGGDRKLLFAKIATQDDTETQLT